MKNEHEEEFSGNDKAAFAGFVTACIIVGIIIGMVVMYGWLSLNGAIVPIQ